MRRAARVDANHARIIRFARDIGAAVLDIHAVPGALDVLFGFRGKLYLAEIKDGSKPASARKLTPKEVQTINDFRRVGCEIAILTSEDDLLKMFGLTVRNG